MEALMREMPKYRCHKEVHALKIKAIEQPPEFKTAYPQGYWLIVPEDKGYSPVEVSHDWYDRMRPQVGGYYIVYADGYTSYSPAKAFENGYYKVG